MVENHDNEKMAPDTIFWIGAILSMATPQSFLVINSVKKYYKYKVKSAERTSQSYPKAVNRQWHQQEWEKMVTTH
jgi:hypothetical protein